MAWVDRLFTGRQPSSHYFSFAQDRDLLFRGSQVFIMSPKQKRFSPQEGSYCRLDGFKTGDDSQCVQQLQITADEGNMNIYPQGQQKSNSRGQRGTKSDEA